MGLKIFNTATAEERENLQKRAAANAPSDVVLKLRSGYQANNRPIALTEWRFTTGDPEVAEKLLATYGSKNDAGVSEWDATGEDNLQLFTDRKRVSVIFRADDLRTGMALWGRNSLIRSCDGVTQNGDGAEGKPCECPSSYLERKEASRKGIGCSPSISLKFRLADLPDIGFGRFNTGSWQLVEQIPEIEAKLEALGDVDVLAELTLEEVSFVDKKTNQNRSFTKPSIRIKGAVPTEQRAKVSVYQGDEPPF